MSEIRLIFIRHGEAANAWGDHHDPDLSENGLYQAQKLVNHHLENGGISRYEKIKFFQKNILKNTNIKLYQELVDNYGKILKEKLIKAEISKGVFKIKQFFPNSKITVVSGSDQNELRWLFKEKRIDHLFNNGIFGSPKNKIEILEEIFSEFKGQEKSIFIGDSKYDFEVSKFFKIDRVSIKPTMRPPSSIYFLLGPLVFCVNGTPSDSVWFCLNFTASMVSLFLLKWSSRINLVSKRLCFLSEVLTSSKDLIVSFT